MSTAILGPVVWAVSSIVSTAILGPVVWSLSYIGTSRVESAVTIAFESPKQHSSGSIIGAMISNMHVFQNINQFGLCKTYFPPAVRDFVAPN